jgi:hypothetical protein
MTKGEMEKKNAPRSLSDVGRLASPVTTNPQGKMSSTDAKKLDELLQNTKKISGYHSGKWANSKKLERAQHLTQYQWEQAIELQYGEWSTDTLNRNFAYLDLYSFCIRAWQRGRMKAAHLVPYNTGESNSEYLFGTAL